MQADRHDEIRAKLRSHGRLLVSGVAREYGVSEDTARRHLRSLAAEGLCRRVYGGVIANSPASGVADARAGEALGRKQALGAALVGLITPGTLVFFDAGSTNHAAARALPDGLDVTVATHDPAIVVALRAKGDVRVLLIGGQVNVRSGAALGGAAFREVAILQPDLLLLGACALDAAAGLAAFDPEDAEMKRLLIRQSGAVATGMLTEKLGAGAPYRIGGLDDIDDLVVEDDAPEPLLRDLAASGIRLHRAPRFHLSGNPA